MAAFAYFCSSLPERNGLVHYYKLKHLLNAEGRQLSLSKLL